MNNNQLLEQLTRLSIAYQFFKAYELTSASDKDIAEEKARIAELEQAIERLEASIERQKIGRAHV